MNLAPKFELPASDADALLARVQLVIRDDRGQLRRRAYMLRHVADRPQLWASFATMLLTVCAPSRLGPDSATRRAIEQGRRRELRLTAGALALWIVALIAFMVPLTGVWTYLRVAVVIAAVLGMLTYARTTVGRGNGGLTAASNEQWCASVRTTVLSDPTLDPAHLPHNWFEEPALLFALASRRATLQTPHNRQRRGTNPSILLARTFPGSGYNLTYKYLATKANRSAMAASLVLGLAGAAGLSVTVLNALPLPVQLLALAAWGIAVGSALHVAFDRRVAVQLGAIELSASDRAHWATLLDGRF